MYYRDADKFEVDAVIENGTGQLMGVEVKAAATVKENDLRGLKKWPASRGSSSGWAGCSTTAQRRCRWPTESGQPRY